MLTHHVVDVDLSSHAVGPHLSGPPDASQAVFEYRHQAYRQGTQESGFEKYCRKWLADYGIDIVVAADVSRVAPAWRRQDDASYRITLKRGAHCVVVEYWGRALAQGGRQAPSLMDVLFAIADESQFATTREGISHGLSRKRAHAVAKFSRCVRRVVPRTALAEVRDLEVLFNVRARTSWFDESTGASMVVAHRCRS